MLRKQSAIFYYFTTLLTSVLFLRTEDLYNHCIDKNGSLKFLNASLIHINIMYFKNILHIYCSNLGLVNPSLTLLLPDSTSQGAECVCLNVWWLQAPYTLLTCLWFKVLLWSLRVIRQCICDIMKAKIYELYSPSR